LDLILKGITRSKLWQAISVLIFITTILLAGVIPVSAESMDGAGGCQPAKAAVPLCCLNSDCPLSYSSVDNLLPATATFALNKTVYLVRFTPNLISTSSFEQSTFEPDTSQGILYPPGTDYHCRNSLESAEPPQI
jgi:hypothetical protein